MAITSKVEICNMALTQLGNFGSVEDIDSPSQGPETTFALWYDVIRQYLLKITIPNFAMERRVVAQLAFTPPFGNGFAYEYPKDCLKVLGFGNIDEKTFEFSVEGNRILINEEFTEGLNLRFIRDIEDVTQFGPEFKLLLSKVLAAHVALDITQDLKKAQQLKSELPPGMSELSGMNAQENPPIRKSVSKFKQAKIVPTIRNNEKL